MMRFNLQYSLRRLLLTLTGFGCLAGWLILPSTQANRLAYAVQNLDSSQPLDSIIPNGRIIQTTAMKATMTKQWSHHKYCIITVSPITFADVLRGHRRITLAVTRLAPSLTGRLAIHFNLLNGLVPANAICGRARLMLNRMKLALVSLFRSRHIPCSDN
jgi:hypothetical protein